MAVEDQLTDHDMIRDTWRDVKTIMRGDAPTCIGHTRDIIGVIATVNAHLAETKVEENKREDNKRWTWRSLAGPAMQWLVILVCGFILWNVTNQLTPMSATPAITETQLRNSVREELRDLLIYRPLGPPTVPSPTHRIKGAIKPQGRK